MSAMVQFTVRLPAELARRLDAVAKAEEEACDQLTGRKGHTVSRALMIRDVLDKALPEAKENERC